MRRTLAALMLVFWIAGCTSHYASVVDNPTPKPNPPSRARLSEQRIETGSISIPVLHATESEFFAYHKELLAAPVATQQALLGIICYASVDESLSRALIARIEELYGKAMADECGGSASTHWGSATVTRCFVGAGAVAHCHRNRVVCVIAPEYYTGVMRHEALHALSFSKKIDENRLWRLLWLETLYVGSVWSSLEHRLVFPRDGFVTSYATKHYDEDMAEFVEACYCYAHREELRVADPYIGIDLRDPRYKAKLGFLRNIRAVTDEEYSSSLRRLTPQ